MILGGKRVGMSLGDLAMRLGISPSAVGDFVVNLY